MGYAVGYQVYPQYDLAIVKYTGAINQKLSTSLWNNSSRMKLI